MPSNPFMLTTAAVAIASLIVLIVEVALAANESLSLTACLQIPNTFQIINKSVTISECDPSNPLLLQIQARDAVVTIYRSTIFHVDVLSSVVPIGAAPYSDSTPDMNVTIRFLNCTFVAPLATSVVVNYTSTFSWPPLAFVTIRPPVAYGVTLLFANVLAAVDSSSSVVSLVAYATEVSDRVAFRNVRIEVQSSIMDFQTGPGLIVLYGCRIQNISIVVRHSTVNISSSSVWSPAVISLGVELAYNALPSVSTKYDIQVLNSHLTVVASDLDTAMFVRRGAAIIWFTGNNLILPDGLGKSLVSMTMADCTVNVSGIQASWILMTRHPLLQSTFVVERCVGEVFSISVPHSNTSGRSAELFSVSDSDDVSYDVSLRIEDTVCRAVMAIGSTDQTLSGSLTNAYCSMVSLMKSVNYQVRFRNSSFAMEAFQAQTSGFAQVYGKTVVSLLLLQADALSLSAFVEGTRISMDAPYYCPMQRLAVNITTNGFPITIATNTVVLAFYGGLIAATSANVTDTMMIIRNSTVDVVSYPFRQVCPQARSTDIHTTSNLPIAVLGYDVSDIPFVIAVTICLFGFVGVDPVVQSAMKFIPSQLTGKVTKFNLAARNLVAELESPVILVRHIQPPIQYTATFAPPPSSAPGSMLSAAAQWADTNLRVSLMGFLGLINLTDVVINVRLGQNSEGTTNTSVLMIDTVPEVRNVSIHVVGPQPSVVSHAAVPFLAINRSTVSGTSILFTNVDVRMSTATNLPLPSILSFYSDVFLDEVLVGFQYSNVSGFHRLTSADNNSFASTTNSNGGGDGNNPFRLSLGCVQWNQQDLSLSKVGRGIPKNRIVTVPGCPVLGMSPSESVTTSKPPPAPPLSLSTAASVFAGLGVAFGGVISSSSVFSLQRAIGMLRIAQCSDVDDVMTQPLDMFTNPTRLAISSKEVDDVNQGFADTVPYASAFRGAVVGNVCILWTCAVVVVGAILAYLSLRLGPAHKVMSLCSLIRIPGLLYPIVAVPLTQPILFASLALVLHGNAGTADVLLGLFGMTMALAAVLGACSVVTPRFFRHSVRKAVKKPTPSRSPPAEATGEKDASAGVGWQMLAARISRTSKHCLKMLFEVPTEWVCTRSEAKFVELFGGIFEPLNQGRQWTVIVEAAVVIEASVTAAILPASEDGCQRLAIADCVFSVFLVLYYVILRPYASRYDAFISLLTACFAAVIAVMIVSGVDDDSVQIAVELMNYLSVSFLALALLQLANGNFFRKILSMWNGGILQPVLWTNIQQAGKMVIMTPTVPTGSLPLSLECIHAAMLRNLRRDHGSGKSSFTNLRMLIETICSDSSLRNNKVA